jgi:tetratricopeptide (TPR) repeat protein
MWRARVAAIAGSVLVASAIAGCGTTVASNARATTSAGTAPGAGATRVWAFSDGHQVRTATSYATALAARRDDLCKTSELGSGPMQLAQALTSLEGVLKRAAGAGALTQLAHTKVGGSAGQAETVAVAEIAKANPGGALAALLIAHQDDPHEARHLENAAVVAISMGYPQEALALLASAEQLPESGYPEMGIDRTARTLSNRAYALIRLGRWSEAVPLLRTAIAREPLLNEAQRNLAVALICIGDAPAAGEAMRMGERRNSFQDIGDPAQPQTFDPAQAYDLSKGQPVKLPDVTYPKTLEEAAGSAPKFESDMNMRDAQAQQLYAQSLTLLPPIAGKSSLTIIRTTQILYLSASIKGTPQLAQLYAPWSSGVQHLLDLANKWNTDFGSANQDCSNRYSLAVQQIDCFSKWCSAAAPTAQRSWYESITQTDAALRAWADAYSRFASGLAANLKDPMAHQWAIVDEQHWLILTYASLMHMAWTWTSAMAADKGTCFDQQTDSPAETSDGGNASAPECSDLIGGVAFNLDLGLIALNVSCEAFGVTAEQAAVEAGFAEAGVFESASYNFKEGSTTVFAGAYAKTKIGGLSGETKGGLYATFDQQGNTQDVGMRALAAADQSSGGPLSASVESDASSWSFVGAADAGEG